MKKTVPEPTKLVEFNAVSYKDSEGDEKTLEMIPFNLDFKQAQALAKELNAASGKKTFLARKFVVTMPHSNYRKLHAKVGTIDKVEPVIIGSGRAVIVTFADSYQAVYDMAPRIKKLKGFRILKDPEYFAAVYLAAGNVRWPGGPEISAKELRSFTDGAK